MVREAYHVVTLITDEYRSLNRRLHEQKPKYGSMGYRHAETVKSIPGWRTALDYGCGKGTLAKSVPGVVNYDPAIPGLDAEPERADLVVSTDVLEHIEPECLDDVLEHIRSRMIKRGFLVACTKRDGSKTLPDGRDPHLIVQSLEWWRERIERYFWIDSATLERGKDATFHVRPRHPLVTVVLWLWGNAYTCEHANTMARMVERHLHVPHRIVCATDRTSGIDVETIPIWPDIARPIPPKRLSCYRRLKAFASDAHEWLGERILSLDLDGVITGDLTPIVDTPEDFKIWRDPLRQKKGARRVPYNGGMWICSAGARRELWEEFDPQSSPQASARTGWLGSDQGWISTRLGPDEPTWGRADGVYSYKYHVRPKALPHDARVVWFHGDPKPWKVDHPWIKEHYR